jgi:hypothetical protein
VTGRHLLRVRVCMCARACVYRCVHACMCVCVRACECVCGPTGGTWTRGKGRGSEVNS